ncbi:MAG TPA: TIGR00282 family metallophosphoesterase, partial [Candidatus Dojkabacteria bacterium]|nr:TIGR00282 family metallophosphoesterase [Candidatus Dojkabacteria bacterium]
MKILFIGDICGENARKAVGLMVPKLRKEHHVDVVIANIENSAHGRGSTLKIVEELKSYGVDVMTSGNHIWRQKEYGDFLDDPGYKVIRPINYPDDVVGIGYTEFKSSNGLLLVVNVLGFDFIVNVERTVIEPFRYMKQFFDEINIDKYDSIFIDFHAEATSEKKAFGLYFDGMASTIVGTHTHVQTADEEILPKGTAYITDVGMVGPKDSVLWTKKEIIFDRMMYPYGQMFE